MSSLRMGFGSLCSCGSTPRSPQPDSLEQIPEYLVGVEVLSCNFPRCTTMLFVVGVDFVERGKNVVHRSESEESLSSGQNVAESRILCDHRFASSQVAGAAIAEPAAP